VKHISQEVQDYEYKRQVFFTVSVIVLQAIPVVFQYVEDLILNLPAMPTYADKFFNIAFVGLKLVTPGVFVFYFPLRTCFSIRNPVYLYIC